MITWIFAPIVSQITKESKIVMITKPKKNIVVIIIKENWQPQYFSWYHFLGKHEIRDYFYWIGWMSYKLECLAIFIFLFYSSLFVE